MPEHGRLLRARSLLAAVLLAGCGDHREGGAWHQVDLLVQPPTAGRQPELRVEYSSLRGRALWALEQPAGRELAWELHLGTEATFSFRPVPELPGCVYSAAVRDPDGEDEVLRRSFPPAGDNPPMTVDVPLERWAWRSVELVLRISDAGGPEPEPGGPDPSAEPAVGCTSGRWGGPVVLYRSPAEPPAVIDKPNILLIGVDTLRADALGVYGRRPSITPAIDQLASESDVWLRAFASANSTNPSFASLMTGLYSKNHGIYDLRTPLPERYTTLAEHLREVGYRTGAVVSVAHLARRSGLHQGFDLFVPSRRQLFAETAVTAVMSWLQFAEPPFFIWLHLFDPHVPHNPPQPYELGFRPAGPPGLAPVSSWTPYRRPGPLAFDRRGRSLPGHADLYPGEVAYLDHQIGRLLAFLRSRGLLQNTLVILVADHGETLGERGQFFDHEGLFDNTTHVPLMIRWPQSGRGRRLGGLVQHFDLFPTLLRTAGIEPPDQDGIELATSGTGRRAVFSESALHVHRMVRTLDHKYVETTRDGSAPKRYFYDLRVDAGELHNLAGSGDPEEARLARLLERWNRQRRTDLEAPDRAEISSEEKADLEALGYVQ